MNTLGSVRHPDLEAAREDLQNRTLANVQGELAKLVYLASTRDYNNGEYYHEGLAWKFSERVAGEALAYCHEEIFRQLALCSVRELVEHLETYAVSIDRPCSELIDAWRRLEPYVVAVPWSCTGLAAQSFATNVRAALAVLECRHSAAQPGRQSASQRR